jgi:hypothetical protein
MNAYRFLLSVLLLLAACLPKDSSKSRTRVQFCADWAGAACSAQTVSACQAANMDACVQTQEAFCKKLVPEQHFSDEHAQDCINAVHDAFADGDLKDTELVTVLRLGKPCDMLISGPQDQGGSCKQLSDCDAPGGYVCVKKSSSTDGTGTCQKPVSVGAGRDCKAAQKTCSDGFYCDGEHCIEGKHSGDSCTIREECGSDSFCGSDGKCTEHLKVGTKCSADEQCTAGVCYPFEGNTVCTDRIVLTRAEPLCVDLR